MKRPPLRFRQIHLDFHTSPDIPEIGARFDKKRWQDTLQAAAVDSITCFAKCHHGWSYHPTKVGKVHPNLGFDLLRAQYDACKEIEINVPIYLSAGVDDLAAYEHPEWRDMSIEGGYAGWNTKPLEPGFKMLDFHSPYLDYLCAQIEEVAHLFPDCDGIFLDIISQVGAGGRWSLDYMKAHDLDPSKEEDREKSRQAALLSYYQRTTSAGKCVHANMPVFHNSGHISRGDHSVLAFQGHLELESLPTGGWGYDHFPESARYVVNLDRDFLGMTGKFHTTWGEFGGFKHPNALRYECAAMIAHGARCSVGDQLHPSAALDESTYEIVGEAYRDVAAKEAWCVNAAQVADVGILSSEAEHQGHARNSGADTGASRILLEEHILFSIVDRSMDFNRFRLLIVPDDILIDDALEADLRNYVEQGGKLLLSGESGLRKDKSGFAFDIGAEWSGESEFTPDFVLPAPGFQPSFVKTPFVMYFPSQRIRVTSGQSVGEVYDPYFNRTFQHYSSHQHTPNKTEPSGFDSGVIHGNIAYLAHPVFSIYRGYGAVAVKEYAAAVIRRMLGEKTVTFANFPSTARVTLTRQEEAKRWVLHLLYANTVARGGQIRLSGGTVATNAAIEVIEELMPLRDILTTLKLGAPIKSVTLEPDGEALPFEVKDDEVSFTLPEFYCHQMVVLAE